MSCSPVDYVECARALFDHTESEAQARAVVSRAYYGAYHAAKTYHDSLPSPGSVTNAGGSHGQLISQLRHPGVSGKERFRSIAVGTLLMAAFAQRVNADYKLGETMIWDDATDALSKADQIIAGTTQDKSAAALA